MVTPQFARSSDCCCARSERCSEDDIAGKPSGKNNSGCIIFAVAGGSSRNFCFRRARSCGSLVASQCITIGAAKTKSRRNGAISLIRARLTKPASGNGRECTKCTPSRTSVNVTPPPVLKKPPLNPGLGVCNAGWAAVTSARGRFGVRSRCWPACRKTKASASAQPSMVRR